MFTEKTVLVLGAGASAPYDFPSGEGLVTAIIKGIGNREGLFKCVHESFHKQPADEFADRLLYSGATSVDAFLEKDENAKFRDVGKSSIAAALLPKEDASSLFGEYGRNWYRQLLALLLEECPFSNVGTNNLSVVTFNYDRSLEYYLVTALHKHYGRPIAECYAALRPIKIIHVYGKLGRLRWEEQDERATGEPVPAPVDYGEQATQGTEYDRLFAQRDLLSRVSRNIQIISESVDETDRLKEAVGLLRESARVFMLGFGVHPTNLRRLKLETLIKAQVIRCTTHNLPAHRRRLLDRYSGLADDIDMRVPHRARSGCFNGTIDEFLQRVGLT
jgi:hypothetical protein